MTERCCILLGFVCMASALSPGDERSKLIRLQARPGRRIGLGKFHGQKTRASFLRSRCPDASGWGRISRQNFLEAADLFRRADEVLGRKLSEIAWDGPLEELTRTANCQPALYVHGLACLSVLREIVGIFPITAAAGLSLGEWTAHAAAGTFSFEEGFGWSSSADASWRQPAMRPLARWRR